MTQDRGWFRWIRWAFVVGVGSVLGYLVFATYVQAQARSDGEANADAPFITIFSFLLPLLLVAMLVAIAASRTTTRGALFLVAGSVIAFCAVLLGLAAFVPCTGSSLRLIAPLAWTLELFGGSVDSTAWGAEGNCSRPLPPGLELANFLAVLAIFVGAVSAIILLMRRRIEALRVGLSSSVDAVIGLTPESLPLIESLCKSGEARLVVVVEQDEMNPLVGAARALGATVIFADGTNAATARLLVRHTRSRAISLRRCYAVTERASTNLAAFDAIVAAIETRSDRRDEFVPRLNVRIDEPRTAMLWRVANLSDPGSEVGPRWLADAISPIVATSNAIVGDFWKSDCSRILVAGEYPMLVPLLDEISWLRWCDWELNRKDPGWRPRELEVIVAGPAAIAQKREWLAVRAPWSWNDHESGALDGPGPLQVEALPGEIEFALNEALASDSRPTTAVIVEDRHGWDGLPERIARCHGHVRVLARSQDVVGINSQIIPNDYANNVPTRFGLALAFGAMVRKGHVADFWTRLAEHDALVNGRIGATDQLSERRESLRRYISIIAYFTDKTWDWRFHSNYAEPVLTESEMRDLTGLRSLDEGEPVERYRRSYARLAVLGMAPTRRRT